MKKRIVLETGRRAIRQKVRPDDAPAIICSGHRLQDRIGIAQEAGWS